MGRDILDFTSEIPKERLGFPLDAPQLEEHDQSTDWSTPEAMADPGPAATLAETDPGRQPPQPMFPIEAPEPAPSRGLFNLIVVGAGLVIAAATGYYFWVTAGRAEIAVNGQDIANAEEVLAKAESEMRAVAAADGAPINSDAACHFAPSSNPDLPAVLCGPVWLGVSPDEQPWLDVQISYINDGSIGQEAVVGEVGVANRTTDGDPADFVRPDSQAAPRPGQPSRSTTGPRLSGGELMLSPADVLTEAEAFLAEQIANPDPGQDSFTVSEDWKCFLMERPNQLHGLAVADSAAWCGPARTASSRPDEVWLPVSIGLQAGPTFGTRVVEEARSVGGVRALPEDAVLTRPDGAPAADVNDVDRPPVAVDFVETFDYQLPVAPLARRGDTMIGVLVTDRERLQFDGLTRTKQIGSGAQSVAAPDGHDLVVATVASSENRVAMTGVLVIDGTERELPRWPSLEKGASLVVVVPERATAVDLAIDNDGRPQTISLLDGTLEPGYPLALYRKAVEPGDSLFSRVAMPAGDPVEIDGLVSQVRWTARDEESAWLPAGTSDLLVEIEGWDVDRPCCEVRIDEVTLAASLVSGGGSNEGESDEPPSEFEDLRAEPGERPRPSDPLRFRVPEDLTTATLRIVVSLTVVQDEQSEIVTEVLEVDLDLP